MNISQLSFCGEAALCAAELWEVTGCGCVYLCDSFCFVEKLYFVQLHSGRQFISLWSCNVNIDLET